MIGIYMSGTGNTKHCVGKLLSVIDPKAEMIPIESPESADKIRQSDMVLLAFPTQFSNVPFMVKDFIRRYSEIWKSVITLPIICVMLFTLTSCDNVKSASELEKYAEKTYGACEIISKSETDDRTELILHDKLQDFDYSIESVMDSVNVDGGIWENMPIYIADLKEA